ncbi:hypothetical protein A2V80_01505 [Candidatus Woesebacteria bacterium RBG_16_39_8b]|uniref:Uncharacterized protein n=1 Tax=Candidatus Woesebacteria bacterium RBG_16_39_8b TaxID=1802482 RepID=A0A1F7XDX5_9BACT|nr:MAG: hypothetical protein A2V80_01505 [Candidatus Woesebacteria bacterium RBG_16_39_8b]
MKWITTNIRFPEDMYMDLKLEAVKKRKSVAQVVREKVNKKKTASKKIDFGKIMREIEELAKENAKYLNGLDTTKIIREMRDER